MAVYTKINESDLESILKKYDIGSSYNLVPIEQGIENTNYFLVGKSDKYILTIFEKRTNLDDLPYFLKLMNHLSSKNINCPTALPNKNGEFFSDYEGKKLTIITFLKGKSVNRIENYHLEELGTSMAKMHIASLDFSLKRSNSMSLPSWFELFDKVKDSLDKIKIGLAEEIESELFWLKQHWPQQGEMDSGVIHGDLFPDNVFFDANRLSGIIDFYFASNDFLLYDIAICLNAWCFEKGKEFNITKARKLITSYSKVRKLSDKELLKLPVLSSGAAMRFFLTRSYDLLNPVAGALVKAKDPLEYLHKVRFHKDIKSPKEYGI